jgi:hypothetical protein
MIIELPKNASEKQIKEALNKIKRSIKKNGKEGNIAHLFGANPNELDGLAFQKKVRKEWI